MKSELSPDSLLFDFEDLSRQFKELDAIDHNDEENFRSHRIAALISHSREPPDSVTLAKVIAPMVEAVLQGEEGDPCRRQISGSENQRKSRIPC